ncbi:vigilin-like [Syngnathoides biaculeatus]|uniref:vigilin-like n=1 Tax=Syngnathoides biaculeatus TaxID=300417 RepID=UPI002ADD6A79|nr:vigilin-like [Syngnathoides biaculeatus]
MGPKGSRIQHISREHEVQIKFPERDDANAGQEASPQESNHVCPDGDFVPRKCDIVAILGRAEKCEVAKAALLALVPVTEDVEVSNEFHRYVIGQKGSGIRKMMEEYEVNIRVPQPELQQDAIRVKGLPANMAERQTRTWTRRKVGKEGKLRLLVIFLDDSERTFEVEASPLQI